MLEGVCRLREDDFSEARRWGGGAAHQADDDLEIG